MPTASVRPLASRRSGVFGWLAVAVANPIGAPVRPSASRYSGVLRWLAVPTINSVGVPVRPLTNWCSGVFRRPAVAIANPVGVPVRPSANWCCVVPCRLTVPTAERISPSARRTGLASGQLAVATAHSIDVPVRPPTSRYSGILRRFAVALSPPASRAGVSSGRLAMAIADAVDVSVRSSTGRHSVVFRRLAVPPADPVRQAAVQIRAVSRPRVPAAHSVGVPVRPPPARLVAAVCPEETSVRLRPPSSRLGSLGVRSATTWLRPAGARFRQPARWLRIPCPGIVGEGGSFAGVPRDHVGHADAAVSVHRTAASAAGACRGVGMATGAGGVALVGHSVSSRTSGAPGWGGLPLNTRRLRRVSQDSSYRGSFSLSYGYPPFVTTPSREFLHHASR